MAQRKEFAANQSILTTYDVEAGTVTWRFIGGLPDIALNIGKVSEACRARAALVGFGQTRIADAAAVSRTDKDGNIVPEVERLRRKHENMMRLVEHYESGTEDWELPRVGGGARGPSEADVLKAIRRATGVEGETMLARWMAKERCDRADALKALCGAASIKKALLEIAAERVRPATDADAVLAALVAGGAE
jgi:hypothetical protein